PRRFRPATSGAGWPRSGSATRPASWQRRASPSPARRGLRATPRPWRPRAARGRSRGPPRRPPAPRPGRKEAVARTPPSARGATIRRTTGETDVRLTLALEGTGAGVRDTGVGFFDHMLDLLARHGRIDLDVKVTGDLQTGAHHTVEDTAIVLGQALDAAL